MPSRPRLTEETFLRSIFQPSKNPTPVGIRRSSVKVNPTRKTSRVRSYNRMPGSNQEILRRTGLQAEYLKGNASLADAKRQLRLEAVSQNIVKPLRPSGRKTEAITNILRIAEDRPERPGQSSVKESTIRFNVSNRMSSRQIAVALDFTDYGDLLDAMHDDGAYDDDGYNVYWYK